MYLVISSIWGSAEQMAIESCEREALLNLESAKLLFLAFVGRNRIRSVQDPFRPVSRIMASWHRGLPAFPKVGGPIARHQARSEDRPY